MKAASICIATMTLVRTPDEDRLMRQALSRLSSLGMPIFATDGGSPKEFVQFLHSLRITVLTSREKGLVPQVRNSLHEAGKCEKPYILYTEPDKLLFFEKGLLPFLGSVRPAKKFGVALSARAPRAFKSFPSAQREAESLMNDLAGEIFNAHGDYCYGPFILAKPLAKEIDAVQTDIGWGWRFHLFRQAHQQKLSITHIPSDVTCPPDQRTETPKDRMYRFKQLRQNLQALVG